MAGEAPCVRNRPMWRLVPPLAFAGPARSRRQLGDARALLPEPARCGVVLRRLAQPGRRAIGEIAAADRRHRGRRGEIDDGLRALLRRDREELGDADAQAEEAAVVVAETGGDEAGMKAVGGDAGGGEAARQLAREENVGELGAAIDGYIVIIPLRLPIVEVEPCLPMMRRRGCVDDPSF